MDRLQTGQMLGYAILAPRVVSTLERLEGPPDEEQQEILQVAERLLQNSISALEILHGRVPIRPTPVVEQLHALGTVRKGLKCMAIRFEFEETLKSALDSITEALNGKSSRSAEHRQRGIDFFNGLTRALAVENYRTTIAASTAW